MLPSETLTKAADLLTPEGKWTQGAYARGKSGRSVHEHSPSAVCFCALGALWRVGDVGALWRVGDDDWRAKGYLRRVIDTAIAEWNDDPARTQAEVVAALRKAAELARSEGR